MKRTIDINVLLAPVSGENPAGEDVRYSPVYEEIKEARRADDSLALGDWQRETKTSDWDKVTTLAVQALAQQSKDLQIAVWLAEALIKTDGFPGLYTGLKIITGLLETYWENAYPPIEEGDLDFRAAPLEFLNDKVSICVQQVPIIDSRVASPYSWLNWQDSRQVGYEADTRNRYGDVDDNKRRKRDELIEEGKVTAEDFDSAVLLSSRDYYESLAKELNLCREEFEKLDKNVDEKFGAGAPRLSDLGKALDDCDQLVTRFLKEKRKLEPTPEPEPETVSERTPEEAPHPPSGPTRAYPPEIVGEPAASADDAAHKAGRQPSPALARGPIVTFPSSAVSPFPDPVSVEKALWEEALQIMKTEGIKKALGQLMDASSRAPSVRERNRCRLLVAKLCLEAGRPDLARPIAEELHALIEELHLERWESSVWVAEVIDALYQCLTRGDSADEDAARAKELFERLCTTDVTRAMGYKA